MINILWNLFEILVNLYQGSIAVYFVYSFLGGKGFGEFFKPLNIAFSLIYAAAVSAENFIFSSNYRNAYMCAAVYVIILFIYAMIGYKCNIAKKLFAAVMPNAIILLSATLCGNLTAIIFGEDLKYLLPARFGLERFIAVIAAQALIFYITLIALKLFRRSDMNPQSSAYEWGIVSALLIISVIIGAYINYAAVRSGERLGLFSMIVIICVVITNILVCRLLFDLIKKNNDINDLKLLKQTQNYNRQYIENLQAEYETVRKLRHDYKNSFMLVSALLESGDADKAKEEISKIVGEIAGTEIFINTDNAVANAVVNSKLSAAKALGIECDCYVIKDISGIDDVSLCRLLSNMLDNAVTACKNEPEGKRFLELSIMANEIGYTFTVKNSISESVLGKNPQLRSTKNNADGHGYGVKIIREVAEKYGGRSCFYEDGGMFCCAACVRKGENGTAE